MSTIPLNERWVAVCPDGDWMPWTISNSERDTIGMVCAPALWTFAVEQGYSVHPVRHYRKRVEAA